MTNHIDIVFDGPPSAEAPRFVEVENAEGKSIGFGEWIERADGFWCLRIPYPVESTMTAYVAWTNTDLTEGKGRGVPLAICKTEATARRLGRKQNVQGCDCEVTPILLYRLPTGNSWPPIHWYGPIYLRYPSKEDEAEQARLDKRAAAIERAKAAGLSEHDLAILMGERA